MKKHGRTNLVSFGLICLFSSTALASQPLWQSVQSKINLAKIEKPNVLADKYYLANAQPALLNQKLLNRSQNTINLKLPMPDGRLALFQLQYSPVYEAGFSQKYPLIRTFTGFEIGNPQNKGRFDITPHGFHGMFLYNGKRTFIDPIARGNNTTHISYYKEDARPSSQIKLREALVHGYQPLGKENKAAVSRATGTLKTYRLAVAAAGEYTAFHGGTKEQGQAAIVTAINRVNEIFNIDLAIQLNLIANNDEVVYTDANSDPYDNTDNDIDTNRTHLNDVIGAENYDIGHIFNTNGGGLAYLGSVCERDYKGGGITGSGNPTGDPFIIDFVAHEFGHQFAANHSYNGTAFGCNTRSAPNAYEPGSGSTIMGYAGLCDDQNIQSASDTFFHSHSIEQINTFMAGAGDCHVSSNLNNEPPAVNAGNDYTIPASTPFMLTGSAEDTDGDTLLYSWEQYETGQATSSADEMIDDGEGPLFRTWQPTISPMRYLPRKSDVLNDTTVLGEAYPTTTRSIPFRLIVRDPKGNTASDDMTVSVTNTAGPFLVTEPIGNQTWAQGANDVVWNTANTGQAPVNCSNVDILLSTDGGETFNTTLISTTANDGNEMVSIPAVSTATARLMVKCSDNIFYAVNSGGNFNIIVVDSQPVITNTTPQTIDEDTSLTITMDMLTVIDSDTPANNLTLQVMAGSNYSVSGTEITPDANFNGSLSVEVTVSDATSASESAAITVTVTPVNDSPVAVDDSTTVGQDSSGNSLNLIGNDTDVDGDTLTVTAVNYSGSGTVTSSDSGITYTPASGFSGTENFTYEISDGNGGTDQGNVSITVTASSTGGGNNSSGGGGGSLPIALTILLLPLGLIRRLKK